MVRSVRNKVCRSQRVKEEKESNAQACSRRIQPRNKDIPEAVILQLQIPNEYDSIRDTVNDT